MNQMMRAVRLTRWQGEPELVTIPVPEPGPGEVLLKVDAAGLCHSDLHLMRRAVVTPGIPDAASVSDQQVAANCP